MRLPRLPAFGGARGDQGLRAEALPPAKVLYGGQVSAQARPSGSQ